MPSPRSRREAITSHRVDLTIPYTFYPVALPHWIAWVLFLIAIAGGAIAGITRGRAGGLVRGSVAALIVGVGLLIGTAVASMVITFFVHDL
jgi:hypothetical protein